MKKVHLTGCKRYNHNGELFLEKEVYSLDDKRADYLLEQTDPQTGFPYFDLYKGDEPGIAPGAPPSDHPKAQRREHPRQIQRAPRVDRPGRAPRQVAAKSDGIEDADAVTV